MLAPAPAPALAPAPVAVQPTGEERDLPAFTALVVAVPVQVEVTIARERRVRVIAENGLLPQLATTVSEGELRIAGVGLPRQAAVRVEVGVPELERVQLDGPGEVAISGLDRAGLTLRVVGEGRITARGAVRNATCAVLHGGTIDAVGLDASLVFASVVGKGRIAVRPRVRLDARVQGEGVIAYAGDPQVHPSLSGGGRVERLP